MPIHHRFLALLAISLAAPGIAWAHVDGANHAHGFFDGVLHPLLGLDHLLAMVAVGLWAGQTGGPARLAAPAMFVAGMVFGLVFGAPVAASAFVEPSVALTIVVLGLLLAFAMAFPAWLGLALLIIAGALHGAAHAGEAPAAFVSFAAGALLTTLLLHLIGVGAAISLRQRSGLTLRVLGGVATGMGLLILGGWSAEASL